MKQTVHTQISHDDINMFYYQQNLPDRASSLSCSILSSPEMYVRNKMSDYKKESILTTIQQEKRDDSH